MLLNKWIRAALSVGIILLGGLEALNWTDLVSPQTAGVVVGAIGIFKLIFNVLAPASGQIARPTNGTVVTQKAS